VFVLIRVVGMVDPVVGTPFGVSGGVARIPDLVSPSVSVLVVVLPIEMMDFLADRFC